MVNIEKCYLCGSTKFNKRSGSVRDREELQYLKSALPNLRLLDFGCGAGGFLLKAQELAATVHSVEPEICLSNHYQNHGLTVFQNLSDISTDIREGGATS